MVKNADLPLDLGAVFVAWVGKDRQLTNSAVLRGRQHFFVHQVFKTDGSRCARPFLECVTTGLCGLCLFTTHDASDGRCKKGKERVIFFLKNLVDLLNSLVATVYVDCTACAPCKRLCVEYTTFARKATYCVRIVQLLRVSDL